MTKRFLRTSQTVVREIMVFRLVLFIDFLGLCKSYCEPARRSLPLLLAIQILLPLQTVSLVALQLRAPPKVSARAPAHRSYHFRGVKLKSCIKKIHHNLYISKQANVRIKHADTEGASHKKFGTDARVQ